MPISFACDCGKVLRARDELAGKKAKCPQCGAILLIPPAVVDPDLGDGLPRGPGKPRPAVPPTPAGSGADDEYAVGPSTYHATPPAMRPGRAESRSSPPSSAVSETYRPESDSSDSSIREYAYLLLGFALIPLVFSLLGESKVDIVDRIQKTFADATPEQKARAMPLLAKGELSDELFAAFPEGKLHGAHLPRDTMLHWVYAGIAAVGFLLMIMAFFSVERVNPLYLLGVGLFTGTLGIILLFAVQFCSQFRMGIRGRGWIVIIMLILTFIGWSYQSALDPDSNFLLSVLGFTFGVGLCEELTKALPLFFYFKKFASMGWRGACLCGLASGIGFGVSEGIMYAGNMYNGLGGVDIYVVRFVSCVALHAMWSASVGIAIARRIDDYEGIEDAAGFGIFALRVIAGPMVLHGLYDTLLKKDMNIWALVVALVSFAWLTAQVELARGAQPDAGTSRTKKRLAY